MFKQRVSHQHLDSYARTNQMKTAFSHQSESGKSFARFRSQPALEARFTHSPCFKDGKVVNFDELWRILLQRRYAHPVQGQLQCVGNEESFHQTAQKPTSSIRGGYAIQQRDRRLDGTVKTGGIRLSMYFCLPSQCGNRQARFRAKWRWLLRVEHTRHRNR